MKTLENKDMYELWSVCDGDFEIMPLFLLNKGELDELIPIFNENKFTIITTKDGKIIKSHYNG